MLKVLKAARQDAESICDLLRRTISEVCASDYNDDAIVDEWLENKTIENVSNWLDSQSTSSFICQSESGKIIGFGLVDLSGEILLNYALPEFLYQGVGKLLLESMESELYSKGILEVIAVSSITAKSFYERNGYSKNGEPIIVDGIEGDFPLIKKLTPNR